MARQVQSFANRESITCDYPKCPRPKVRRTEQGRLPSRRKWCYLHFNGELAGKRKAYVNKLKKENL